MSLHNRGSDFAEESLAINAEDSSSSSFIGRTLAKRQGNGSKGLTTPGISISEGGALTRSETLQQTLENLSSQFGLRGAELAGLRGQLKPGFGALTTAAVGSIRDRGRGAIGNLRENLARRRVLGSSFAQDALTRAEAELSKKEAEVRAQTTLQEIEANIGLIDQEFTARANEFNVLLQQGNFEATLGANFIYGVNALMQQNQQFQQQMEAERSASRDRNIGTAVGIGTGIALSDRRYKEDITFKYNRMGIKWYTFRYLGQLKEYFGVMAQEIEKIIPQAVKEIGGVKYVDYGKVIYGN